MAILRPIILGQGVAIIQNGGEGNVEQLGLVLLYLLVMTVTN